MSMLHRFKITLAKDDERSILAQEQPLADIDVALRALMKSFPDLQARVEENVHAWTTLTYSVRTAAASFRSALVDEKSDSLDAAASSLCAAGDSLLCPRMGSTHKDLRAFNEGLRSLRLSLSDAVATLRDREYYKKKLHSLSLSGRRSDAVQVKTAKNERKLAEVSADLEQKIEELEAGLQKLEAQKEGVLADSLRSFLRLQNTCFESCRALNPILGKLPSVSDKDPLMSCGSIIDENSPRDARAVTGLVEDERKMSESLELAGNDDSEEDERYFSSKKSNVHR